tara:strand:+ start:1753 stop:3159 length:1407 start_codon:yes stop_codon:yes gene_type:complete
MTRLNQSRRQQIGYVYKPQVNNDIGITQSGRKMNLVQIQAFDQNQMSGEGFMDLVRGIFNKGKQGAKYIYDNKDKIGDAYSGEIGTTLRNLIPDSDDTARPGFAGEKHMILQLKNGKNGVANYMGPGTEIEKRLRRNDPGRTPADTVAKRHDLDYALAQGARTTADQQKQVRAADNRMINSLKKIQASKGDAGRNIQAGMRLIQAKTLGEDIGVLGKDKFSGPLKNIPDADKVLLMSNRARLTQEGYGLSLPGAGLSLPGAGLTLPGGSLKQKLIRNMVKQKRITGQSRSTTYPGMKNYKLNPRPLVGAGAIADFIANQALPSLAKTLGLPVSLLPKEQIKKVVNLGMSKTGKIGSTLDLVAKYAVPILTQMKIKKMTGKGMSGAGVKKILVKHNGKLQKSLKLGLMKALHSKMSGGGLNPAGGSFWSDFKKGFTSVFKPFAKVFAPIASAVGVPEIGVPLGIVGDML